ncbi:MAG: AmmeMemoRadiSam system protein B [Calditrichaeota bacterium]|nr:AmmeMemoRadiSam system protein B [Calditrichota bacterium]
MFKKKAKYFVLFGGIFFLFVGSLWVSAFGQGIRPPGVAGQFYPADPQALSNQIDMYLRDAKDAHIQGKIVALIAPHAGYVYSGWVAAYSYKQLVGRHYDTVVLVGPSHVEYFPFTSVYPRGGYRVPLGVLKVDAKMARKIADYDPSIQLSTRGHLQENLPHKEHCLEVQLPFLIKVLKGPFKIVPIIMGDQDYHKCKVLGEAIAKAARGKNVLIVASSDLSHYYPYEQAEELDHKLINYVKKYDYKGLARALERREVEACGGGPIVATMIAAKKLGAKRVKILDYRNSGDTAGTKSRVVGYMAAVFYQPVSQKKKDPVGIDLGLTPAEKQKLLHIAKVTIESVVQGKSVPKFTVKSKRLREKRGAFVTITENHRLRGCIGYILPVKPLYQTVREVAEEAALHDPRFMPVRPSELQKLHIEISVLTVPKVLKNKDLSQIKIGRDGLIIRKDGYQGILLPQVATDYNWNRLEFVEETCRKAGLPRNAWKDPDTEILYFSAEVFGEE